MFGGKIGVPELLIILVVIALVIKSARSRSFARGLLGLFIGAFVGFLLRPSVTMIGQLPFETVITRGSNLRGVDGILRPAAEQSFNYMIVGAIVGAVIFGIWGSLASKPKPQTANVPLAAAASTQSNSAPTMSTETSFCGKCGKSLAAGMLFCSVCGTQKS